MDNVRKAIYVLGTGLSHDGSACLLKDGRICVAIEKERLTRRKHDGGNDRDAIKYCLAAEGIRFDDLSLIVQNANFGMFERGNGWFEGPRFINRNVPVATISHHLAHAYSAIGTSPFDESAIMIIDGCGSGLDECTDVEKTIIPEKPPAELKHLYYEKDSYYIYKDHKLTPIFKDFSPWGMTAKRYPMYPNTTLHSIGGLYLGVSTYVFNGFEDPGKLMGLAPYGRAGVYDFKIFELKDGRAFVNYDWMKDFNEPARSFEDLKGNFQYYADIAYWVQREVERAVLYIINSRHDLSPAENLAYAGGVALNAVANRRVLTESKFKNLYIQPAAGDNGLAIGCAYYGWLEVLKRERVRHNGSTYLGKSYDDFAISQALSKYDGRVEVTETADSTRRTAELLAEGKVVGWLQGGAEFGPRALGHRSILADPRNPGIRDHINARIKFREDFRPFAPSVMAEESALYFDCDYESPYMILIAQVREEWRDKIPSVIHRDDSARIQTVTAESDAKYYRLLKSFKAVTGISVLLNTSFNKRGMPIVETPEQALDFYLDCDLDVLVLNNYVISKAAQKVVMSLDLSRLFNEDIKRALEHNPTETRRLQGVYQINIVGVRSWTIDLLKGSPEITEGPSSERPTAVIEIAEADFQALRSDPENEALRLYRSGKLKIEGNPAVAMNIAKILRLK